MTIETLNAIKAEATTLQTSIDILNIRLSDYEIAVAGSVPPEINQAWTNLATNLTVIVNWVNQAIEDGTVEEPELTTMQAFLAELKAVFDKYAAVIEYVDETGYGLSYGGADFFRVTVTDPVSGNVQIKDIFPDVADTITSVNLV